jgi:hypothetical protein
MSLLGLPGSGFCHHIPCRVNPPFNRLSPFLCSPHTAALASSFCSTHANHHVSLCSCSSPFPSMHNIDQANSLTPFPMPMLSSACHQFFAWNTCPPCFSVYLTMYLKNNDNSILTNQDIPFYYGRFNQIIPPSHSARHDTPLIGHLYLSLSNYPCHTLG